MGAAQAGAGRSAEHQKTVNLTVWTDTTRQPGFQEYEKLHPNVHFNFTVVSSNNTVGGQTIEQKILLANREGSGWPDIAFLGQLNDLASLERPGLNYIANIKPDIPSNIVHGYPAGVLNLCETGGELYCLRNDLASNVLWYNAPLMEQWGYKIPTTWQEYQQLGLEVAKQHPGYYVGDLYGRYGHDAYFWPSECAEGTPQGKNGMKINTTSSECLKMANLLQPLAQAGVLSYDDPFGASFPQIATKFLMIPAANWFAANNFSATYHLPSGQWAAALTPSWPGEKDWTGDEGGGVYVVSKHASDVKAAAAAIQWMSTYTGPHNFQSTTTTYPAYGPAAKVWAEQGEGSFKSFYAKDPQSVFQQSATLIWPGYSESNVAYDADNAFALTMTATASKGGSLPNELPSWQQQLSNLAEAAGYQVSH